MTLDQCINHDETNSMEKTTTLMTNMTHETHETHETHDGDTNKMNPHDDQHKSSHRDFFLIQFAHVHMDFRLAELHSVLEMFSLLQFCQVHPLPNEMNSHFWFQQHSKTDTNTIANTTTPHSTLFRDGISFNLYNKNMEAQKQNRSQHSNQKPHDSNDSIRQIQETDMEFPKRNDNGQHSQHNDSSVPSSSFHGSTIGHKFGIHNHDFNNRPFLILSFPKHLSGKDDSNHSTSNNNYSFIVKALSRCVLIRSIIELWGIGTDIPHCAMNIQSTMMGTTTTTTTTTTATTTTTTPTTAAACTNEKNTSSSSSPSTQINPNNTTTNHNHHHHHPLIQQYCIQGQKSWKLTIHTFGSKYTREEQNDMRAAYAFLPFTGKVQMEQPDMEFILIREIEVDVLGSPLFPRHCHTKNIIPQNDARPPLAVYFGRIVVTGLREGKVDQYKLNKRKYLGPTSMDTELSMIMTNLAQVRKGSFCFDPFVGTGSILLTCALEKAYCFGTDIDIRILKGKGNDENIYANFKQFNLPRPEIVRSDNSIYHRHFRHQTPLFNSIVCDPPYGIRAGARKTGSKLSQPRPVLEQHRHDHIAQTKPYAVSDVMADLLDVSARTLTLGGRLVYIIPSMTDFDPKVDLPRHDCLECIHICYQPLQIHLGRRMVTMKKIQEYDDRLRDKYLSTIWVNGPESADKCANIREKLIEMAKCKPGYEEKSEIRRKKRKARKEEMKMKKLAGQKEM